jgi:hypothetical protein
MQKLWIIHNAIARIEKGTVTIQIDAPRHSLPRVEAFNVADKTWLANQFAKIQEAVRDQLTKVIPLTKEDSRIRLGGGFLHVQGNTIVIPQRDARASLRPLVFCECGGVFEESFEGEDWRRDYLATMLTESAEIVRLGPDDTLYIPKLDGEASQYNKAIEEETISAAEQAGIPFSRTKAITIEMIVPRNPVTIQFADKMPFQVVFTMEVDTSSLEAVGILRYPDLPNVRFQDTECFARNPGDSGYLARQTHVIDVESGWDIVYQKGAVLRQAPLADELARIDRQKTQGRYTNEKLEEVIKNLPFPAPALRKFCHQPKLT